MKNGNNIIKPLRAKQIMKSAGDNNLPIVFFC